MAAEYIWGFSTDEFEKTVQVESFKPSQAWEGGAEGDGWVVLQLQVGNKTKGMRIGFPSGKLAAKRVKGAAYRKNDN